MFLVFNFINSMKGQNKMRIIEINRTGWTGDTITEKIKITDNDIAAFISVFISPALRIKSDDSFSFYGHDFRLTFPDLKSMGDDPFRFEVHGEGCDHPLVKGIKFTDDSEWLAYQEMETFEEMNRSSEDPFVAAAQVLFNII